jgi:23S rRNA pseudouridine1911/1915/1917 synthase
VPRPPPARLRLAASPADAGAALWQFLAERGGIAPELARSAIARGGAYLRGRRERDAEAKVRAGDKVEVVLRERPASEAPAAELKVLHLDAQVLAVDKAAGVSAQEDRGGGPALPQLCSELLARLGESRTQALLVHRLDRGTTGVTVLARTRAAQAALLEEFREHRAAKEYRALVAGAPLQEEGEIDLALGAGERGLRKPDPRGESARTRWRVLERHPRSALLAVLPETGRTHQIRVHLRQLGCPLLGDVRYGGPAFLTARDGERLDFGRPLLHALRLSVRHPQGGALQIEAPSPADFERARAFLPRCD